MQAITQLNNMAFEFAKAVSSPAMNTVMLGFSKSFIAVLPILVLYLILRKDRNVFALVFAGLLLYAISDTIKVIVKEPRPCNTELKTWINVFPSCESTYSFPSNHASVLTGLAFFTSKYKYVRVLYVAWLVVVLFSRFYLGLHYLSDILAGATLSIIISLAIYIYREQLAKFSLRILPFMKKWFGD